MAEFKVIDENPITLSHMKAELKTLEKEKALTFRGEKTKAYLENFDLLSAKEVKELSKKIKELNIPRFRDRHITKVLEVMPKDVDSLKITLSGETLTVSDDDLKKILDVIPQ